MTRRRRAVVIALLAGLAAAVVGCGTDDARSQPSAPPTSTVSRSPSAAAAPCGREAQPAKEWDHVIWIWLENKSYDLIIGPKGSRARAKSPYLNALADACGLATNFHNATHPSLPNYRAAVSGSTGRVKSNCDPGRCPQYRETIFEQLAKDGREWRTYQEGMAQRCQLTGSGRYAPKHNPAVYFPAIREDCKRWSVGFGADGGVLAEDLADDRLPAFAFVTPDMCHNTHDCDRATGDAWLADWVPRIVESPAYRAGKTLLVVTYDEGSGAVVGRDCTRSDKASCHIAAVVVAPTVPVGTRAGEHFTLYSLLRTTQELLDLSPLLGAAKDAPSMRDAFNL